MRIAKHACVVAFCILLAACAQLSGKTGQHELENAAQNSNLPRTDVAEAQRTLNALGYDAGAADGVIGPKTSVAVRAFQADRKIAEDGILTASLIDMLKSVRVKAPDTTLPSYELGETFTYSDGSAETVQKVEAKNYLLITEAGTRNDAPADFLQPLKPGAKGQYKLYRRSGDGASETPSIVSCAVSGPKMTTVSAGTFETLSVVCRETAADKSIVDRRWDYAPQLRNVVRETVSVKDGKAASRDLVAIQPPSENWPAAARTGLDWAIVSALEGDPKSPPISWSSTGVAERYSIHVDHTRVERGEGSNCLHFSLERTDAKAARKTFPALACQSQGKWTIPAREPYVFATPPKGLTEDKVASKSALTPKAP